MGNIEIHGETAPGWEAVADVLRANVERGEDTGASVAVYHRGAPASSTSPPARSRPTEARTTARRCSSCSARRRASRRSPSRCASIAACSTTTPPVATYWPEFAAAGKGDATVAQLLSHQLGLFTVDGLTFEQALDWDTVTAALAAKAPEWEIGSRSRLPRRDVRLARRRARAARRRSLARDVRRRRDRQAARRRAVDRPARVRGAPRLTGDPERAAGRPRPGDQGGDRSRDGTGHPRRAGPVGERGVPDRLVQLPADARRRGPRGERRHERRVAGQDLRRDARPRRRRAADRRADARSGPHPGHAAGRDRPVPDDADDVRPRVHGPRRVHAVLGAGLLRPPRRRRIGRLRRPRAATWPSPTR